MLNKAFFAAWLIAGASIDNIFNSKGAMMVFVIAMIVIVACAAAMGMEEEWIKAETKTKGENSVTKVSFDGESDEIIAELCEILAKGADAVTSMIEADGEEVTYEKAFYAIVMTAIDTAQEDGFEINSQRLALALMFGKNATITNE